MAAQLPTLVMLHGSNGYGGALKPLTDALRPYARVETPNLLGHGGRPVPERLTVPEMAEDVLASFDALKIARAYLFGYSFGGYLGLYLARHRPERLQGLSLLAAKFIFDERTVQHWTHLANPERINRPGNDGSARLTKAHFPQDWVAITNNNRNLFRALGAAPALTEDDLSAITVPVQIISGEQDQLVPLPESLALGHLIKGSQVSIFTGVAHPLPACPIPAIAKAIGEWLAKVEGSWNAAWATGGGRM